MPATTAKRSGSEGKQKESRNQLKKFIKFFIGVALLPACLGITVGTYRIYFRDMAILREQFWFFAGFAAYVVVYSILQNPIKTYVFGHELSHAIWTWLFRGKVLGFQAGASGGSVTVTKSNTFISLAPYFFPIYTVLTIAAYLIAKTFWKVEPYYEVYRFVLGFTWAFHLILTVYALLKDQDDARENGTFFSVVFIYFLNVLALGLLLVYMSDSVTLDSYFRRVWEQIGQQYTRIFSLSRL